jgi:TonB-dependent SusC/RagA subfamily outer membrane receptor
MVESIFRMTVRFSLLVGLVVACAPAPPRTAPVGDVDPMTPNPPAPVGVTAEDFARNPTVSIEDQLASKYPGVWVTRSADGGISVRLRGGSSINGNNEPLYVLDGISIMPGPNGALAGISPYDIESIQVVRDATGTAMYGMRGVNGVIIIKTKKPPVQ